MQSFDDFVLADLQRIGDHTRGLFEAEASVAPSAAHFLEDKKISIVFRHWITFKLTHSGKTRPLSCNQLRRRFGFAFFINRHSKPHKEPPAGFQPFDQKNQKCVFYDAPRRLIAEHRHLDSRVFPSGGIKRRIENPFIASEFSMGTPRCKEFSRLLR
jgi:hypothetical protein